MTAVASPPSFANLNRPGWINGGQALNSINADDVRGITMFMPRKTIQRTNSSSSVSSTSSASSTSTVTSNASTQANGISMPAAGDASGWPNPAPRKRPTAKAPWPNGKSDTAPDYQKGPGGRALMVVNGINGTSSMHQQQSLLTPQNQLVGQGGLGRPGADGMGSARQPVLCLLSLNGSFERKTISVPFGPDTLRIGRQTNAKTVPTPVNGFFDSKVLSRQHAEIWADNNGKIWIRDVKSSNGTFVNGTRLSPENRESEPHELQTHDHLELGIDIVHEDQKTVVHHKVAAKVEHAGFITPATNVLEMNFGDLDPSGNAMMLPMGGPPARGRAGSQPSVTGANRIPPGNMTGQMNTIAQQRQFWLNPITTEHIVKKLHAEMRNARLQNQDLARTSQFINALLSKEDIKNAEKPDVSEPPKTHIPNGNISFRSDGGKTRFSEPPAPPPSQPLPEKPDAARPGSSDVPSLKRAATERSKPTSTSPIRQDNSLNQILLLTEALNNAKKELDNHTARVRDLEEMLTKEREARLYAEDMMQKMEESNRPKMNGSADVPLVNGHSELDKAFDPPTEQPPSPEAELPSDAPGLVNFQPQPDKAEALAAAFQARIDSMASEMNSLREQLEAFRMRAEKAESERDADRTTLAEMVRQIQQRDEDEERRAVERKSRSASKGRRRVPSRDMHLEEKSASGMNGNAVEAETQTDGSANGEVSDVPTLSRANTIKAGGGALAVQEQQDPKLLQTLPYTSMIGVVLLGMGLMAYLNGWQPQPRLDR
ncbi:Vacuolar protein sorting-associated protein 64 [Madurella mycetomatis]|uniref:Vacuolar protein sorting-associated protein 64 n=1 Tax=Madurella mycetomatis TaxID=100816 RepID=A0A175VYS2_9PEZI|nr:Vacuolar protein sorting-associated protein 64 [Madurella mycetomatis]